MNVQELDGRAIFFDPNPPPICWPADRLQYPEPRVNIGALDQMEEIDFYNVKQRFVVDLLQRLEENRRDVIRGQCVESVTANIPRIRACYSINLDAIDDAYLVNLIFLDACYIIELIFRWSIDNNLRVINLPDVELLFITDLKYDLVILQNQIPFFVLNDIFQLTAKRVNPQASLISLVLSFLQDINPFEPKSVIHNPIRYPYHILDLVHQYHKSANAANQATAMTSIYSASELGKAGVSFKPNQVDQITLEFKSSMVINRTLTMPVLRIEDHTKLLLQNLVAYEKHYPGVGNYITSYAFAMMMLANTEKDHLKLVESKIIFNLNGHQYFVDFIKKLCTNIVLRDFSYAEEWRKIDNYSNNCYGSTRRTYFPGAWTFIVSLSALFLFIFTGIQTYCALRGCKV